MARDFCPVHGPQKHQASNQVSDPHPAAQAAQPGPRGGPDSARPSFVGEWLCQFYNLLEKRFPDGRILLPADTIIPPEPFPVTIYRTPQGRLEGYYPNPPGIGFAGLYGNTTNDGKVWNGTFYSAPQPPGLVSGQFLFVLSDDGTRFNGAWTARNDAGIYPGGAPQPWWGFRVG